MVLVGSILNQDALAPSPLFLSRYVIYLCFKGSRLNVHKFVRKTYRFLKINFFLLQKKYILFVGESTAGIDKIKMCQAIRDKIRVCHLRFCTQGREKGAQWFAESNTVRVTNFHSTRPPGGSKNIVICFLANMRYVKDGIRTGYIRKRIYISVPIGN